MKPTMKNQKIRRKHEIRYHKIKTINKVGNVKYIEHPCFVFLEIDGMYNFVSLTHSEFIEGVIVIKLRKNPNPEDNRDSFYVAEIKVAKKEEFQKIIKHWKLNSEDEMDIRKLYDETKKDDPAA